MAAALRTLAPGMLALALCVVHPLPSAASPAEVFGFGSRQAGLGGAVAARVDDFSAAYYNPAGLAAGGGKRVSFGLLAATSRLEVNDERYSLTEPFGIVFGATAPAPLGGPLADRVHVGLGLYLLPDTIVRVIARQPEEPFYPYYDNRTQRLVVLPAVAVRATDRMSVGVAVNVLAGLAGAVVAAEGPTRAIEARVDEEIGTQARLHVGARFGLFPGWDVALVFRQEFSIPFSTVTDNEVAGEPIDLDIRAVGLYTPHQLVLGTSWRTGALAFSLDATVAFWSAYNGPFVEVESELPLVGPLAGELPDVPWKDTIGVRAGAETALASHLWLRGGYGFETSPVPARQPGVTNLLDGPKHTLSLGLGWTRGRMRIDLHAQAQLVGARTMEKVIAPEGEQPPLFDALRDEVVDDPGDPATQGAQISNPGFPRIETGGAVLSGGLTVEVSL